MFKAIHKWYWKMYYKNPPTKSNAYFSVVMMWLLAGVFLGMATGFLLMASEKSEINNWIVAPITLVIFAIIYMVTSYIDDKGKGKIDKIHEASLEYWHKKNKEYGIEK